MARQVMYDPFGMYTTGMQQGTRDEAFLQDQTRRARGSDFDFGVMMPLRQQQLQQQVDFSRQADPFRLQGLQDQQFAQQIGFAAPYADMYGDTSPLTDAYRQRFGVQQGPEGGLFRQGRFGQIDVPQSDPQDILALLGYPRDMQERQFMAQRENQGAQLQLRDMQMQQQMMQRMQHQQYLQQLMQAQYPNAGGMEQFGLGGGMFPQGQPGMMQQDYDDDFGDGTWQ